MPDRRPSLIRRLTLGLGAQAYSQATILFVRLAEVPLLLSLWGVQLYGEWLMLAAIPAWLAAGDGGFADATARQMTIRAGAGDRAGALTLFRSTFLLLLAVSAGLVVLAFAGAPLLPLDRWFGFTVMSGPVAATVVGLLILHVVAGFQSSLLYGGFMAEGRYGQGIALMTTIQLLEFGGLAIAVLAGGGPVAAAGGWLAGRLAGLVMMRLVLRRTAPWLRYGLAGATWAEVRALTAPAFASLAFPLGNAFNTQALRLVVGALLGPAAVAVFVPIRILTRLAMQPRAVLGSLMQAEMAMAHGAADYDLFRRLFRRSSQFSLWGGLAVAVAIALTARPVLDLWTGGAIILDWPLTAALLLAAVLNSLWYAALMVAYATNRHGPVAIVYLLVYGLGATLLAWLAVGATGLAGAGWALLAAEAIMLMWVLPVTWRMSDERPLAWLRQVLTPPWIVLAWAGKAFTRRRP